MNYSQFLFSELLLTYTKWFKDLPYDLKFSTALSEYEKYDKSSFNDSNKGEYQCIEDYIKDKFSNLVLTYIDRHDVVVFQKYNQSNELTFISYHHGDIVDTSFLDESRNRIDNFLKVEGVNKQKSYLDNVLRWVKIESKFYSTY